MSIAALREKQQRAATPDCIYSSSSRNMVYSDEASSATVTCVNENGDVFLADHAHVSVHTITPDGFGDAYFFSLQNEMWG